MKFPAVAQKIIALKNADVSMRNQLISEKKLNSGYHIDMQHIHRTNAVLLEEIISEIGFPTEELVGKEAADAAWLVIQHSICSPNFMRFCASIMRKAVNEQQADSKQLAYLEDRIAVLEGKTQRYGTQFDWNENGELSPNLYDDLALVNKRRQELCMISLEQQTELIRKQAEDEHQFPPNNATERQK